VEVLAQPYATCHFIPGKDSAIPMEAEGPQSWYGYFGQLVNLLSFTNLKSYSL